MTNANRDENNVPVILGTSSVDNTTPIPIQINPVTKRMKIDISGSIGPLTTKGDLYTYDTSDARLPVGTDGQSLVADSTEITGIKWSTPAGGGDMVAATYDPATVNEQLVGLTATQTLTNKTLTTPAGIVTNDITESTDKNYVTDVEAVIIGNTSGTNTGDQTISDATITTTDITTNNATTLKHGFLPKLSGTGTEFLNGNGTFSTPAGGGDVSSSTNITDNAIVRGDGGAKGVQESTATINDNGTLFIPGIGTGALGSYDIEIGDTDGTPTYGLMQIGNATFGRTSLVTGSLDLDGSLLLWNNGTPATSNIEFAFAESSNSIRFAIPKSGVGNATYNPRSMLIAGPAPVDDEMVTVGYWQGQGIFDNLVCDTGTDGADLGVQNNLEVEGDIFTDSIKESTTDAGVTIEAVLLKDGAITGATIDGDSNTITNMDLGNEVDWQGIDDITDATAFASGDKLMIYEAGVGMRKIDYDDLPSGGGGGSAIIQNEIAGPQVEGPVLEYNSNGTKTVDEVIITLANLPGGQSFIVTAYKNGTTTSDTFTVTTTHTATNSRYRVKTDIAESLADGDVFTLEVTQVGSTTPGSDLVVQINVS